MSTIAERECPGQPVTPGVPDDGLHCHHWYDGDTCCRCDTTQPDTEETK